MTSAHKKRRDILTPISNALLLVCVLVGLLRTFLSLYPEVLEQFLYQVTAVSFVQSSAPIYNATAEMLAAAVQFLTLLAVILALVALILWSLPKFRLPAAALYLALLAVGIIRYRTYLPDGARLLFQPIANMFAQRVGWIGAVQVSLSLPSEDHLSAVILFLAAALALLAPLLGWAIVRIRRWWLVLILTLPPLLPGLLADLYPDWRFFVLLAAVWCSMLLTSLCRTLQASGQGALTLLTLPLSALLLTAILLVIPQETYIHPEWAKTARVELTEFGNRLFQTDEPILDGPEGIGSIPPADSPFASVDLSSAGPLAYSGATVLRVTSNYTGRLYLRGASMLRYTGTSWEPLDSSTYNSYMAAYQEEWGDRWVTDSPLLYPSLFSKESTIYSFSVLTVAASDDVIYLPYQLANQSFSALQAVADAAFYAPSGLRNHTVSIQPDLLELTQFTPAASTDTLRTEQAYEAFVEETYLHLSLSPALDGALSALISSYRTTISGNSIESEHLSETARYRLAAAEFVADILAEQCEYNPDTPVTPDGYDFVSYFLGVSKEGYCMHFASTATLMLRYLGVPARYVSGYLVDTQKGKTVDVPDYNAHAWVEIYLPNYGWYPVEVTPGYEGSGNPAAPEQEEAPSSSPSATPTPTPTTTPTPTPTPTQSADSSQQPSTAPTPTPSAAPEPSALSKILPVLLEILKWVGLAAGTVLVLWLGQYLPKRHRTACLKQADPNRAVLYGYRCLLRLTRWGGLVEAHALELAQKARFSQHTLTEAERETMIGFFAEERQRIPKGLSPLPKVVFRYLWGIPRT